MVDIVISGLIPGESNASNKEESGTNILLFFGDGANNISDNQIIKRGFANEEGEFRAEIDRSKVGKTITCRIMHVAYKFKDENVLIMPYGAFHTAKMEPDGIYQGTNQGANVGGLGAYYARSVTKGNNYRSEAFEKLRETGARLSEIPFLYWLRWYLFGILAFAADYFVLSIAPDYFTVNSQFKGEVSSPIDAIYLSVVTVTTLGYGDIVPASQIARMLASFQAISGVVLVGLFLNSLFSTRS